MNKDRLLRLADLLEQDALNPTCAMFNLEVWGKVANCGTVACAVGLAALSGIFKDEGFVCQFYCGFIMPAYRHTRNWTAVCEFFEIDTQTSRYLFSSYSYRISAGPEAKIAVAQRIREVCC